MIKVYNKLGSIITPIKLMSTIVLLIGVFDNITNLLQHARGGTTIFEATPIEWVARVLFIFCGIFGLIGNGRTKRIRATIVSIPLIYLSIFYTIILIEHNNNILYVPIILSGLTGLWTLLFGDIYE